jgi:hypothetical protein
MALVHNFGSTPILARNYQSATYLAEFCFQNGPPAGLRCVDECPDDIRGAIEFAPKRFVDEAIAAFNPRLASSFSPLEIISIFPLAFFFMTAPPGRSRWMPQNLQAKGLQRRGDR